MKIIRFEDLEIWKISLVITRLIYDLSSKPKFSRDFGLRDQIRKAVISISSNIVEGFESNNNNVFIRYLKIAKGSAGEVRNQLYTALAVNYINQKEFDKTNDLLLKLASKIGAFINYLEKQRATKKTGKKK